MAQLLLERLLALHCDLRCPRKSGAVHELRMVQRPAGQAGLHMFILECEVCRFRIRLITDLATATELDLEVPVPAAAD